MYDLTALLGGFKIVMILISILQFKKLIYLCLNEIIIFVRPIIVYVFHKNIQKACCNIIFQKYFMKIQILNIIIIMIRTFFKDFNYSISIL